MVNLEILKEEAISNNFKGIDDHVDPSCAYDYLIRFCEYKYGKKETWDYIEKLFKEVDVYTQDRFLICCSERNDPDTNKQRYKILIDLILDDVIDKSLIVTASLRLDDELFDDVGSYLITWRKILKSLDRSKHERAFQYISTKLISKEIYKKCNESQLLSDITIFADWANYDITYEFIKNDLFKKYNKEDVKLALKLMLKHECITAEAKETSIKLLKEVMLQ